jgi:ABC-type multidrug transport system fused ATPase/permease subunit
MLIQKSLQSAMSGKTTLVIAHRLSTLKNMDRIVVIQNGKIIETGTHNRLLRQGGEYSKLWHIQTQQK